MKQQVYLSQLVNSRLVWFLVLLISLLLVATTSFNQFTLIQVGDDIQGCGEHCIDVGSLNWPVGRVLSSVWPPSGGNSPTGDCGEHCIDVGSLDETPDKKLNWHNL